MENNGWIKLHRKLQAKGYYKNSQYVHLWVHLLLLANHKEHEYMHDGGILMVKEGQLITGRKQLSEATGIPETTVERILKMLESEHQIGQQKTNKYRVITILNWKEHQDRTAERTTNGQQTDTYKNDKKEKNTSVANAPHSFEVIQEGETSRVRKPIDDFEVNYEELCAWATARRGFRFVNKVKQFTALKKARALNIGPAKLKDRWKELESEVWYQEHGIDWASVISSFDKKA